jgi:FKBP-type peptidyl-prolyl cis-trans isomerase 2
MTTAKNGDAVQVHYTGQLGDGTVFDSSRGGDPISFTLGSGQVIPGFDAGVEGMNVGETKHIVIPADQAYGPRFDEAVIQMPRDQFPPEVTPEVGMVLRMQHQSGALVDMTIVELGDGAVTLDGNHPLAGQDLHFDLELVAVG